MIDPLESSEQAAQPLHNAAIGLTCSSSPTTKTFAA
jgi:hypothetical protein